MLKKLFVYTFLLVFALPVTSQITTSPELPTASQKVTITFDSSKESRLGYFTGDLYAHTGLITENSSNDGDWKYVIESWGNNTTQPKLTNRGNGLYELEISPDIRTFYKITSSEELLKLAFVFRSSDGKEQTNNLYVDIFPDGLAVKLSTSANSSVFTINQQAVITAVSSVSADIRLKVNENTIAQNTGLTVSADHTFPDAGYTWLIAEATANNETVYDSLQIFVRDNVILQPKPAAYKNGINYPSNNSAALVLWAPLKENVFVVGDFNNWELDNNFQMKKDGDYFWLEIPNLEKGKEYCFQYLIDGSIKIADPYTEKISDPWNDKDISSDVYPGLIAYPEGKTTGITSVLQPGQDAYQWQVPDFQVVEKGKLVIYELLVRDFMTEHTYKAVREKLDYLEDLRINVLELMPVNEFEGNSSWGYNPSFYFAPDKYYGPKNELKALIDECHKRGIAVVMDMVLNHSYGQSPFVQMYMDNWTITPDNPWYNQKSNFENPSLQWGFDFNHDSEATRALVDSINSFWINEYKVDGFRFDFTKGFSNTPYGPNSWGSEYDASRISNLERMSSEIWKRKNDALVIFEHLADNSEETVLANYGILLWGNMNYNYTAAGEGDVANSNLSWGLHRSRGWNEPNLVTYAESHDQERIMYVLKQNGLSLGDYNIRNQSTALDRTELLSVFLLPLPGPKMIWQFEERGYDQSINRCVNGSISNDCRLDPKPPYWQYLLNPDRLDVFRVMAKLSELKQKYDEFSPDDFDFSLNGASKWYILSNGANHVVGLGNFDVQNSTVNVTFPGTGKWYEFFTRDSIEITQTSQSIQLNPGEYRLYSTREFEDPRVITSNKTEVKQTGELKIYPNPASTELNISGQNPFDEIRIYSVTGKLIYQKDNISTSSLKINTESFSSGMYLLKVYSNNGQTSAKFVVK